MPFPYRVEKRIASPHASRRRGRGRPSDWSTSWQKKLIVLRLCGLPLKEILQLLNTLSDGRFTAKERRAQQILLQNVGQGYQQLCPSEKLTMRRRLAFLRSLKHHHGAQKPRKQKERHDRAKFDPDFRQIAPSPNSGQLGHQTSSTTLLRSDGGEVILAVGQTSPPTLYPELPPNWAISSAALDSCLFHPKRTEQIHNSRPHSAVSSRTSMAIDLLKRGTHRSSLSDIMSLIRMSFSSSSQGTFGPGSRGSRMSEDDFNSPSGLPTNSDSDISDQPNDSPEAVLALHKHRIRFANRILAERCCSQKSDCIHKRLSGCIQSWDEEAHCYRTVDFFPNANLRTQIKDSGPHGNNSLFFAARCGASVKILMDLIVHRVRIDLNAVNEFGQTFLFVLDPRNLELEHNFQVLISELEARHFNFDQIDHDGRHFLSFLCTWPSFDVQWIFNLMESSPVWKQRVEELSILRDASGYHLYHYAALNPNDSRVASMINNWIFQFSPTDVQSRSRGLVMEDNHGNSELHTFLGSEECLLHLTPLRVALRLRPEGGLSGYQDNYISANINRYNMSGCTPAMVFLEKAVDCNLAEGCILRRIKELVSFGANLNARSRDGGTILHSAAKHCWSNLLLYLLTVDAQADIRDHAGYKALDYAAENFNNSRGSKAPVYLTARSLKIVAKLLDFTSVSFKKSKKSRMSVETMRGLTSTKMEESTTSDEGCRPIFQSSTGYYNDAVGIPTCY